jgi:predicted transcriptional regulator
VNDDIFRATFLPSERDAARRVLDSILGPEKAKNIAAIAEELGFGRGVVQTIIRRASAAGLVHHDGPPTRYFTFAK